MVYCKKVDGVDINEEKPIDINLKFDDLELNKNKEYLIYEFWKGEFLGEFKEKAVVNLEPRTVKILTIHPKKNIPQFLSTNRHFTHGAIDILNVRTINKKNISLFNRKCKNS